MITKRLLSLFIAILALIACRADAGIVNMDRMLREHKVYIATTETASDLSKYWPQWRPKEIEQMTMLELFMRQDRLDDGGFVFWIIDRSKTRLIPEQEALLPIAESSIEPNEVIVYASKTTGKRVKSRNKRWDVLISTPNKKWLYQTLDSLTNSGALHWALEERGTTMKRYSVRRLNVVTNTAEQTANNWIKGWNSSSQVFDWEFVAPAQWDPQINAGVDTLFLFTTDNMDDKTRALMPYLPQGIQDWIGSDPKNECAAMRSVSRISEKTDIAISAALAPCRRQLDLTLEGYKSADSFPASVATRSLHDLSPYGRIVLVTRMSDRSAEPDKAMLEELAGKLTAEFSGGRTGFELQTRQDLKELVYAALQNDDELSASDIAEIRRKAGAYAIAVADLSSVSEKTTYSADSPQRLTQPYPAFSESEPSRPAKPSPDDRWLFGGYVYSEVDGSRSNDPKYKRALRDYDDDLRDYRYKHRRWEERRDEHERSRDYHEMEWKLSVNSTETASVSGNLRVYDLREYEAGDAGKVIFACSLKGSSSKQANYSTDNVRVRGESNSPSQPGVPSAINTIDDKTIISHAFENASASAFSQLARNSILPKDRPGAQIAELPPVNGNGAASGVQQNIEAEAVGSIKLSRKPVGEGLAVAREAAASVAYPYLLSKINSDHPGVRLTDNDIMNGSKIVSEYWDAKNGAFRVRVRFTGSVQPPEER